MNDNDERIKEIVKAHLSELKDLSISLGVYSEDKINDVPLDDLIKFGLSYQIIWLDSLLKNGTEIKKNTISSLRLYNEMCKNIIGIKSTIKQDQKVSINDPIQELKKKLKIERIENHD